MWILEFLEALVLEALAPLIGGVYQKLVVDEEKLALAEYEKSLQTTSQGPGIPTNSRQARERGE